MATSYIQWEHNIPDQLKAEIVQIPSKGVQVPKPDLDDDKKRWLVVGICLHSVVSPALRNYIGPIITNIYNNLKKSKNIDTQTFPNYLKKHPSTNKSELNYEAINNNKSLAYVRGKKDLRSYDFNVQSAVDFSKLFLQTHMAHYTGFDGTCDSSALLGLIINIDGFPPLVKAVGQQIRQNLRNPWAHCNFGDWDNIKFISSFQMMNQLIKNLQLSSAEETRILGELNKWEIDGINFLRGTTIGLDLLNTLKSETRSLAQYLIQLKEDVDANFIKVGKELENIQLIFHSVKEIKGRIAEAETVQSQQQKQLTKVTTNIDTLAENVASISEEYRELSTKVCFFINDNENKESKLQEIQQEVEDMKEEIIRIKYTSQKKPEGRVYFYPPDRIKSFVGRSFELELLQTRFLKHKEESYMQVISGLGGCGKSTLAVEFAWQFQSLYPGGIFWFSAESNEILDTSVSKLAIDVDSMGNNAEHTLFKTLKWLSSLEAKWLLVVDNADSDDISGSMKEVLMGTWKRQSKGHILITSRREPNEVENSLNVIQENCISLDVLSQKEGVMFLILRTGIQDTHEKDTVLNLVEELGGLPLALEQAGAFIRVKKCSFAQYMEGFSKKRQKLLNAYKIKPNTDVGKNRLAVKTTWLLNMEYIQKQSEEEGIGNSAVKVMEIASFLFPDDIPEEILNSGYPEVEDEELLDSLRDELVIKQIVEILTRFSLFQKSGEDALSVHRLVQEIIRDSLVDQEYVAAVLQKVIKMVNKALESTNSPFDALCCRKASKKGELYLWSKLAANANALKAHIAKLSDNISNKSSFHLNLEMANIIHTTAIYHSIHQRQDEALADQEQLLNIIAAIDIPESKCQEYTTVKVPLLEKDRKKIQDCLAFKILNAVDNSEDIGTSSISNSPDQLRQMGDTAYKENRFHDAIHFYTECIKASSEMQIDIRVILNRGTLFWKIKDYQRALDDAEKCITMDSKYWKAYCLKSYAIASMVKDGLLPPAFEMVGLASASIAAELNEDCLLEYQMKINYPIIVYKIITTNDDLGDCISALDERPHTTLLLKAGLYTLENVMTTKSVQIIGIEDGVQIFSKGAFSICRYPDSVFKIAFKRNKEILVHFENLFFVQNGGQVLVTGTALATFYKCKLSNGYKGCDGFPRCNGGDGCIAQPRCSRAKIEDYVFANEITGRTGYAGVCAKNGGMVFLDNCVLDRCGGGGALSCGDGAVLKIKHCTIQNMRQMGVEARYGGKLIAEDNVIINNQFHGVAVGPRGLAEIRSNYIQGNGHEGMWCGGVVDQERGVKLVPKMKSENASEAIISNNIIIQNGLSGLSLEGGTFEISGNKIVDNWLWGMMITSRSSTYVVGNDIYENKCGGIRIGVNYSASVIVDGNTIQDHTGPDLFVMNSPNKLFDKRTTDAFKDSLAQEIEFYSRLPITTNRNMRRNNNTGVQHPRKAMTVFKACCSCFSSSNTLQKCSRCHLATYCSKVCQRKHWKKHKYMCTLIHEKYTVKIKMADTRPMHPDDNKYHIRTFHPSLKGIREGPPPDRKSSKQFIVKVQSGQEYGPFDPQKKLLLYDRSVTLDIRFVSPELYCLVNECGVLAGESLSTKKIFCFASFEDNGKILNIHTENLPPFQTW